MGWKEKAQWYLCFGDKHKPWDDKQYFQSVKEEPKCRKCGTHIHVYRYSGDIPPKPIEEEEYHRMVAEAKDNKKEDTE